MPHGTAQHRLRQSIMFHLVKDLGRNNCFRCKEIIKYVSELSIDHKIDWLHNEKPRETFFDLENISFSHRKCNKAYLSEIYRGASPYRKIGEEGTAWCRKCQDFLPVSAFYKNKKRWNGVNKACKPHCEIEKGRKTIEDFPNLPS